MQTVLLRSAGEKDPGHCAKEWLLILQTEGAQKRRWPGWNEPLTFHKPQRYTSLTCLEEKFPFPEKTGQSWCFLKKKPDKSAFFCWNIFLVQICGWEYPSVKASSGRYLNRTGKGICFLKVASRC